VDTVQFWDEEMRRFPHCEGGAAVWVVRREGSEMISPVTLLFGWASGQARGIGLASRPPLGSFLKAMNTGKEELINRDGNVALWVEPLASGDRTRGCLGVWFDAAEPWREGIFLWAQGLGARLAGLLEQLETLPAMEPGGMDPWQGTLFPLPPRKPLKTGLATRRGAATSRPTGSTRGCLLLPRPVVVPGIPGCVGVSREMMELGRRLGPISRSGVNVLLSGESGTGKEIVAQAIHHSSDRSSGAFIGQNCAALPESLFESELFGHKAGAFTGAASDKKGLLAAAHGGTFFLDEIGDMPQALQIKLLRVMQERKVRRIGDIAARPVDLRFIAATHKDLPQEIRDGRFRLDLFFRLKVISVRIPPLRHRPEDVAPLFSFFLKLRGKDVGRMRITEKALTALQRWRWPGNVRELENEASRFVALYPDLDVISHSCLSEEIQNAGTGPIEASDLGILRELGQANEILEKYLIRKAIAATEGRKAAAARRLGLSRQGLYKKIQRYGMTDLVEARIEG
jgi:transcriptional regulator with AAA-type ATPase domain